MENQISEKHIQWLAGRMISEETAIRMDLYSGRRQQVGDQGEWEVASHPNGEILCFPFMRKGEIVNEKYRAPGKVFFQRKGGKKVFWNADVLDDPELHDGTSALVITEGELDALAAIDSGYPFAVSVPDGAPPPLKLGQRIEIPEPQFDDKYHFIINDLEALKKIKRIVIAVDNDEPGKRLAEELVRRLRRSRCSFVNYPADCKDLNDVKIKYGFDEVLRIITEAKPYPVNGLYDFDSLPSEPDLRPFSTGFGRLDQYLKPFYPGFMVVTGFAGSGKSSFVNQMVAQMCARENVRAAIASFEMRIQPFVTDVLINSYMALYERVPRERAIDWMKDNFYFIAPNPNDDEGEFNLDWLIERAEDAVIRYGIRVLVIDPWNEVEHTQARGESLTEYTGRAIKKLKRFARDFEVLVILVAHPTKVAANKEPDEVSLYDVSDSAHFANKADFGVVVARHNGSFVSEIFVKKIRYQPMSGYPGSVTLSYDPETRTFSQ